MNQLQNKIKAVLFDFGGTIDSDGVNWKDHFYPIYRDFGVPWSKEEFDQYFYFSDDTLVERTLKKIGFKETLQLQVSLVLKKGGLYSESLKNKIVNKFFQDSLKVIRRNTVLFKKLEKKYQLGIVSNFYGNMEAILKELGLTLYFKSIADSARVGVLKPNSKIFYHVLNDFKLKPSEAVFVGDSLSRDMRGSKNMGMPHIWLRHREYKQMNPCCKKDKIITSLMDLEEILL